MALIKSLYGTLPELIHALNNEEKEFLYARGSEPRVEKFNSMIAPMESKAAAVSFASGVGAISAALFSFLKSGDHVLYNRHCYSWARHLFTHHLPRFGVVCEALDNSAMADIESHIKPNTRLIYTESPTYFFFETLDLQNTLRLCRERGIMSVLDNSYLGPLNLKPHLQGFDIILHSATKIICGTGEAMGGVICTSKELRSKIFKEGLMSLGAVMTGATAEIMCHGLETYRTRTTKIAKEVRPVVEFLRAHKKIRRVLFPWDTNTWDNHPDFNFPVGLMSFELATESERAVNEFCENLSVVRLGVSYGSREPLLIPSIAFSRKGHDLAYPIGLCRFSIGEQSAQTLIADLEQGLKAI